MWAATWRKVRNRAEEGKSSGNMREKMPQWMGFRWLRPQKCRAAPQAKQSSAILSFLQPKWDVRPGKPVSFVDIGIISILGREWEKFLLEMHVKEMTEWGTGGEITQLVLGKCLRLCHRFINSPELQENVPVQTLGALVCPTCYKYKLMIPVKLVFSRIEQLRTGTGEVKWLLEIFKLFHEMSNLLIGSHHKSNLFAAVSDTTGPPPWDQPN